jgi:hypothetical protein
MITELVLYLLFASSGMALLFHIGPENTVFIAWLISFISIVLMDDHRCKHGDGEQCATKSASNKSFL